MKNSTSDTTKQVLGLKKAKTEEFLEQFSEESGRYQKYAQILLILSRDNISKNIPLCESSVKYEINISNNLKKSI